MKIEFRNGACESNKSAIIFNCGFIAVDKRAFIVHNSFVEFQNKYKSLLILGKVNEMDIQSAKYIFDAHDGIMKSKEIVSNRIYDRFLRRLINEGYVEKIKHGYYQWQDENAFSEAITIAKLFPDAVLCMESALQYYGYTDRTPDSWCLAIDKHSTKSRFRINYPRVKPHYIPREQMELGVEEVQIEGTNINIFNRERVIIDCLRRENKMDVEIFRKAIQAYIKDSEKNIPRLMEYAKRFRIEKKVREIIGVWI